MTSTINKDALVAAVVALAEAGIPTDTQELLLQGDPMRGIKPGALQSALMSALSTPPQPEACEPVDKGIIAACKALGHEGVYVSWATLKRAIAAYSAALTQEQKKDG